MIVITLTDCPPKLRGDLSKWLLEINAGVYVGKVSARVREELWLRICQNIAQGRATMVFSTNNEQGLDFRVHNTSWIPVDFEGVQLIRRPATVKPTTEEHNSSKAAVQTMLRGMAVGRMKKRQQEGYVVVDIETTGLQSSVDEIIEIAAVRVVKHQITEEFSVLVQPEKELTETIIRLTGITPELLQQQGCTLAEAMERFVEFIGNSPLVGYNIAFDSSFLNAACKKTGRERLTNMRRDALSLARRTLDEVNDYKLETLTEYFKISSDERHRALADCRMTFQVYEKLNEL